VRKFEQRRPDDDPDWMWYFDERELAATILLGPAAQARRRRSPRSPQMPGPLMC
jgi:hypothetical protein